MGMHTLQEVQKWGAEAGSEGDSEEASKVVLQVVLLGFFTRFSPEGRRGGREAQGQGGERGCKVF